MGKEPQRYSLKLTSLKFISSVDTPAQETATVRLIKRRGANRQIEATARVAKLNDELGLVFGWALTTKAAGQDYYDLHGDNILEEDLIKVAAEYLAAGAPTDEMHDEEPDGRVVFAMPLTAEVAKAFGIDTDTHGLMVAIKPSPEVFAKFKSGELTGFSIGGYGLREPVRARKSADKRYLTDEVQGHQHEVSCWDGGDAWMTDATAEGAMSPHRHTVTRGVDGTLTVLADSGHTHTLTEMPKVVVVEPETVVVSDDESVAATSESPRAAKSATVNTKTRKNTMDELEQLKSQVAALTAELAAVKEQLAAKATEAEMDDEEKAHYNAQSASEQKRFRALEKSARKAEVAKAKEADTIEVEFNGQQYRKSAGPAVIELAKAAKAQAEIVAKQAEAIEKAEIAAIAKSHLGWAPGGDEVHEYTVACLRKGGNDELTKKSLEMLKGMKATSNIGKAAPGYGGGSSSDDPEAELEKLITAEMAKANSARPAATSAVMKTQQGLYLYGEIRKAKKGA